MTRYHSPRIFFTMWAAVSSAAGPGAVPLFPLIRLRGGRAVFVVAVVVAAAAAAAERSGAHQESR